MAILFYPGPSTVYKEVPLYVQEAYDKGILSVNHRSKAFAEIIEITLGLLKDKLNIPEEYEIVFTSSATECWEIITQSLLAHKSFHLYNGEFGEKWFHYTQKLLPAAEGYEFDLNEDLLPERINITPDSEIICITQNETSNGTQVGQPNIQAFKCLFPDQLIAVDATSSMAGIALNFATADIWYASVQKCFGLPAGLGLMVLSPKAIERAYQINENRHYNSLVFMLDNIRNLQTHYTPNVLGIYLMMKVLQESPNIVEVEKRLMERHKRFQHFIERITGLKFLCINEKVRSVTISAVKSNPDIIENIKLLAAKNGILLGNGYGSHKKETFRIANFPAIEDSDFQLLEKFLKEYSRKL
ncbi:MAG: aminotransferase class V-fold PLP-dependent enzyme [Bacteroidota bacterium]|nr:aminotransferase class V-fold PLP-dependent enzyme [Bacteroidota bacterium]